MSTLILQTVISGVLVAVFSVLITQLVASSINKESNRKLLLNCVNDVIDLHNKINHSMKTVPDAIKEHKIECGAPVDVVEVKQSVFVIKMAVLYLVRKAGGNPTDMGF